jgi:hypothetical protein
MEPNETIQPEDSVAGGQPVVEQPAAEQQPVVEQPVIEPVKSEVEPSPAKKTFWSKVLPWVIVALLFFIGGLATIFFTLYQPLKTELNTAKATITELTDEVAKAKIDKELLTAAQTTIAEQKTAVANANQKTIVYKFLVDVNAARVALEKGDTNSALQAINFARTDLTDLKATNLDAAALSGFAARLDDASKNITEPTLSKSRQALDTLFSNLLLLVNNLP